MKKLLTLILIITISAFIYAGDVANFVNLGFSPSGDYFLFGEYGIVTDYQKAYANMWLVDVKKNSFVSGGVYSGEYNTIIEPGESSLGGLLNLIVKASDKTAQYKIDFLDQGRPLYVRINDDDNVDVLNFRDFVSGLTYKFTLIQKSENKGTAVSSSFYINLETTDKSGKVKTYNLGNSSYFRKNVSDYKIERIIHSSSGSNLVVLVSKYITEGESVNVRYMVETISLK